MAKTITVFGRKDKSLLESVNLESLATMTLGDALAAPTGDAKTQNGGSMSLLEQAVCVRLLDANAFDGNGPQELYVTITVNRKAATADEQARIEQAKTKQADGSHARKMKDAEGRMREIDAAKGSTLQSYEAGLLAAEKINALKPKEDTAAKVREAIELASALSSLIPKALPAGQ